MTSVSAAHTVFIIISTKPFSLIVNYSRGNNIIFLEVKSENSIFERVCGKNKLFILFIYFLFVCLFFAEFQTVHRSVESAIV